MRKRVFTVILFLLINILSYPEDETIELIKNGNAVKKILPNKYGIIDMGDFKFIYNGEKKIDYKTNSKKIYINGKLRCLEIENEYDFEMIENETDHFIIEKQVDLSFLKNIKNSFYLSMNNYYKNEDLAILRNFENLKYLSLSYFDINNTGLQNITNTGKLEYLDLSESKIDNKELEYIKRLKELKYLNLARTELSKDGGLINLLENKNLICLNLNYTQIDDSACEYISKMTQLKELYLEYTDITDKGLEYIAKLTNLTHLDLYGTKISGECLNYIKELDNLVYLNIGRRRDFYDSAHDKAFENLSRLKKLKNLDLRGNYITDAGFKYVLNLDNLEILDAAETRITNNILPEFIKLKNLKYINFKSNGIDYSGYEFKNKDDVNSLFEKIKYFPLTGICRVQSMNILDENNIVLGKIKKGDKFSVIYCIDRTNSQEAILNKNITIEFESKKYQINAGEKVIIIEKNNDLYQVVVNIDGNKKIIRVKPNDIESIKGYAKVKLSDILTGWVALNNIDLIESGKK